MGESKSSRSRVKAAKSSAAKPTAGKKPEIAQTSGDKTPASNAIPPEVAKQVVALRASVRENFGKATMAMMMLPRYRNQSIADLQHLVLEPLMRDRLAMAYPGSKKGEDTPREMIGFAVWASVSQEVDARITEQVRSGSFPIRLKPDEWNSGDINWLLDIVAPSQEATTSVIANFRQVVKAGQVKLHPFIARLVPPETLEKMGAEKLSAKQPGADESIN